MLWGSSEPAIKTDKSKSGFPTTGKGKKQEKSTKPKQCTVLKIRNICDLNICMPPSKSKHDMPYLSHSLIAQARSSLVKSLCNKPIPSCYPKDTAHNSKYFWKFCWFRAFRTSIQLTLKLQTVYVLLIPQEYFKPKQEVPWRSPCVINQYKVSIKITSTDSDFKEIPENHKDTAHNSKHVWNFPSPSKGNCFEMLEQYTKVYSSQPYVLPKSSTVPTTKGTDICIWIAFSRAIRRSPNSETMWLISGELKL